MNILIFGGTTEGREISHLLAERGAQVLVCVATEYGREEQGKAPGITVLTGRKDRTAILSLLEGADLCIDATHPYAENISRTLRDACDAAGVPLRRLRRRESAADGIQVADAPAAAALLAQERGNILLTTGSKELGAFSAIEPQRLYPRVLPSHESLSACEAAGIPHRNILAMQGPFSQELNEALIRQYHIAWVVTKDGGAAGGFPEKARAAETTGAELIVLCRPEDQGEDLASIVKLCEEMMR